MKNSTSHFYLSFIFLFLLTSIYSQEDKVIPSKKLLKDFEEFMVIVEAHPDPYTNCKEELFKTKIEEVKASLDSPHTQLDYYKKIASIMALINDGHSRARLPRGWMLSKRKEFGAIPFEVYLDNSNKLYVIEDYNEKQIPVGSEITSINNISVESFLNKIDPFISYEKLKFRNTIIDRDFEDYLYVAFGMSDNLVYEYIDANDSSSQTITIENISYKEWKKYQKDNIEEREKNIATGRPYKYENLGDGVGHFIIYAFSTPSIDSYNKFLSQTFKEISKEEIHSLIIDVRGNFGGWPMVSSKFFHYITDNYFKTMARTMMKVSNAYKNNVYDAYPGLKEYRGIVNIPNYRFSVDLNSVLKKSHGSFVVEESMYNEEPINKKYEFEGDCYLLTNRDSFSAASTFASTFQCYRLGEIIGEETGGTKIFRANAIHEVLSRSQVIVSISTSLKFSTCFNEELEGVKPTIEFVPTLLDLINDNDTQLKFTQELIKERQLVKE